MASQQILFAETIAGMKKAFKRKAYESDSDSDIDSYSNRGHKLKRRARFAHKGQLVPAGGPSAYTEYVDYDGVRRAIIHRNPPLIDEEGYEIDSGDDEDRVQDAEAAAAETNPYANIRLEHILAPLTASTDLPNHPTLSKPFTTTNLNELVKQSRTIMQKENHSLWKVRHLLTALCGDYTWVPCEMMVGPSDIELYSDDHVARHLLSLSKTPAMGFGEAPSPAAVNGDQNNEAATAGVPGNRHQPEDAAEGDISMTDMDKADGREPRHEAESTNEVQRNGTVGTPTPDMNAKTDDASEPKGQGEKNQQEEKVANPADASASHPDEKTTDAVQNLREMAKTNGSRSPYVLGDEQTFVHPMFLPPSGAKPDRDVGLPEPEAEDIRRLLALYVQKQEEICRGTRRLCLGFMKADKLRKDVLHWSKAEAHSGPNRDMSDGEDWYDKEEWGLTEDLKKGQDEEEEDTVTTGKKTRNRK